MVDRRRQLGERLDVIMVAMGSALSESESEDRGLRMDALVAATDAAWADYRNAEQNRCSLRLVPGAAAAPAGRWTGRNLDPAERSAG